MSSTSKPFLVDWCSHEAVVYATTHWHYSGSLPPPPRVCLGAWEDGEFVGCIVFARGATRNLCSPYGLKNTEGCELVRIAMKEHKTPVSRVVRIAIRMLRKSNPGLRLVVSFADPSEGHHGGIYQAGGWLYTGTTSPSKMYVDQKGKKWHERMISKTGYARVYGKRRRVLKPEDCHAVNMPGKHRYLFALDEKMRAMIEPLRKPYPKPCVVSTEAVRLRSTQ